MSTFIDIVMLLLFLLFMIFIFGGYHKNKSAQREADERRAKEREQENLK
ncbi:MAG: hypothetical protein PHX44_04555 [Sulfurimonas sp.]|nr:hypothetical protein [Sulfurimonas sp.]MDD2652304.1 hypothetical protein [Sulfurimonas sp.]MDD3451527.1 hypothetical protein [Sulfurimonas sp.]